MIYCPHCNAPYKLYHKAAHALPEGEDNAIALSDLRDLIYGGEYRQRQAINLLLYDAGPYLRIHGWVIKRKRSALGRGGKVYIWKQRAKLLTPRGNHGKTS